MGAVPCGGTWQRHSDWVTPGYRPMTSRPGCDKKAATVAWVMVWVPSLGRALGNRRQKSKRTPIGEKYLRLVLVFLAALKKLSSYAPTHKVDSSTSEQEYEGEETILTQGGNGSEGRDTVDRFYRAARSRREIDGVRVDIDGDGDHAVDGNAGSYQDKVAILVFAPDIEVAAVTIDGQQTSAQVKVRVK